MHTRMDAERLRQEGERLGRARLRLAWAWGAVVQLAFWALDLALVPEQAWLFLGLRVGLVGVYAAAVQAALRSRASAHWRAAVQVAMFAMTAVVSTMTFLLGGFGALYSYFVPLSIYSICVLMPWTAGEGALFVGLSLGYYLAGNGLLLWRGPGTWRGAVGGAMFVTTAAAFALLTTVLAGRARRAELELRLHLERANAALEASLASLRDRESRLATLGGMTSAIVHDLRNPLSAILALSRSALEEVRAAGGPAELAGDLAAVVTSGDRLRSMLEEMLAFARRGAPGPRDERVEVTRLVTESLGPMAPSLRSAGVSLALRLEGAAGAQVLADREALRRALENLVKNAAEAIGLRRGPGGAAGEPRGHVEVEAVAGGRDVVIRVVDDGCGIPEGLRAMLFEPFATSGKAHGTGLGLMMARNVARAHGGELTAEPPPPGGGAAFRLTLPLAPEA